MTFDAHKHVRFEPFLDYLHKVWHLLLALCSDAATHAEKNLYRCTSTFSALNHCGGILLKWFCYLYAQTFPLIFQLFVIFNHNFAKIVAPSSNRKMRISSPSERAIPSEKMLKTASKSTHKRQHKTCSKYTPSNEQHSGLRAWQNRHTNTTFSHLQPVRVVRPNFAGW